MVVCMLSYSTRTAVKLNGTSSSVGVTLKIYPRILARDSVYLIVVFTTFQTLSTYMCTYNPQYNISSTHALRVRFRADELTTLACPVAFDASVLMLRHNW
jgi:type II secretory pathway component GspD/PulD (secretin)